MTTTLELVQYYPSLLILQYIGKPNASAMIQSLVTPVVMPQTSLQEVTFALAPTSGAFVLSYNDISSASINWNDSSATIQTKLRAISGLSSITVTGEISSLTLVVTFTGVTPPALSLVLVSSTLVSSATPVVPVITETDLTLPLQVQAGFNLIGDDIAVGNQLDVIGDYVGVSRSGPGFSGQITLNDADFLSLIRMAIIKNYSGSSLSEIQAFLFQFFPDQILVYDYQNMQMSYLISTSVGSQDLVQLFVTEGLIPSPMGVQVATIIYAPVINQFFGFRTYTQAAYNSSNINTYADYQGNGPWLSYSDAIVT